MSRSLSLLWERNCACRRPRIRASRGSSGYLPSVPLAEHECEWENEELVIEIVADMHNPVAPVFSAAFHDERSDDAGRAVARLGEVAHRFTGSINPDSPGA